MIYLLFHSRYKSTNKHCVCAVKNQIVYPCMVILNPNIVAFIQQ